MILLDLTEVQTQSYFGEDGIIRIAEDVPNEEDRHIYFMNSRPNSTPKESSKGCFVGIPFKSAWIDSKVI